MGQNSKPKELTELIKVVIDSSYFLYMHIQKLLSVALIVRLALVKLRGGASMVAFLVSRSVSLSVSLSVCQKNLKWLKQRNLT